MSNKKRAYCSYCKDLIDEDDIEISGSEVYHVDCLAQKQCQVDEFGDDIPEEEE